MTGLPSLDGPVINLAPVRLFPRTGAFLYLQGCRPAYCNYLGLGRDGRT
jgi:hypothetical protein